MPDDDMPDDDMPDDEELFAKSENVSETAENNVQELNFIANEHQKLEQYLSNIGKNLEQLAKDQTSLNQKTDEANNKYEISYFATKVAQKTSDETEKKMTEQRKTNRNKLSTLLVPHITDKLIRYNSKNKAEYSHIFTLQSEFSYELSMRLCHGSKSIFSWYKGVIKEDSISNFAESLFWNSITPHKKHYFINPVGVIGMEQSGRLKELCDEAIDNVCINSLI